MKKKFLPRKSKQRERYKLFARNYRLKTPDTNRLRRSSLPRRAPWKLNAISRCISRFPRKLELPITDYSTNLTSAPAALRFLLRWNSPGRDRVALDGRGWKCISGWPKRNRFRSFVYRGEGLRKSHESAATTRSDRDIVGDLHVVGCSIRGYFTGNACENAFFSW